MPDCCTSLIACLVGDGFSPGIGQVVVVVTAEIDKGVGDASLLNVIEDEECRPSGSSASRWLRL